MVKKLEDLVGETITAMIPQFSDKDLKMFKLLAVENGGIWLECPEINEEFLSRIGATMAPKTLIFFVPFAKISHILGSLDVPTVSEKAAT